jgi:hypothetical protein
MKAKKTLGEMEQEFLEALQVPYNCICFTRFSFV